MIHPTAIIDPKAKLGANLRIGPYSIIDAGVELGDDCELEPHVHLTGNTVIGRGNQFYTGCVIGGAPQDLKYHGEPTRLTVGDRNVFRENVTVHRSAKMDGVTEIGSHNFLMAQSHVGHNVRLGNHVILANGALLAGHATVDDRVFISGNCLVHQFTRIGTLALMQGGSGVSMDVPPYTITRGDNGICGLNVIGMRRAGIPPATRLELKRLYLKLFRTDSAFRKVLAEASADGEFNTEPARTLLAFCAVTKRGLCKDTGRGKSMDTDDAD